MKKTNLVVILAWLGLASAGLKTVHGAPGTAKLKTRRRAVATRWLGDDAVFAKRPFESSPPFPEVNLEPGAPMEHESFPVVYSKS